MFAENLSLTLLHGYRHYWPISVRSLTVIIFQRFGPICLLGPFRTGKHLWCITPAAIAVTMVTGITICL